MSLYLLSESASGYGLFLVKEADVIAAQTESMQAAMTDFSRFSKIVQLTAFSPFQSAEHALENANLISEGTVSSFLENFLEVNLPTKSSTKLGVHRDPKFKSSIAEAINSKIKIVVDEQSDELLRAIRTHFDRFISGLSATDTVKAQLGLAHSYSRSKVKFNVHKADNMIIQASALLDQLDKDINTFAMRVREWYSWHFPELIKVVPDNIQYARVVNIVKNKSTITEELIPALNEILSNEEQCQDVLHAAKSSMGTDVSDIDLVNINLFASRVIHLAEYRASLHSYLVSKMNSVAPNLAALIGEQVGARLISHAGSLTSLAKYPASTVQILGAEKALFRALKTKGKTPKYGLLYHSTFIGKAKTKNKGRISRYLANKCSIASRMDCFSDHSTDIFGRKLREQVEERLTFYETGAAPRKNIAVMHEAVIEASADIAKEDALHDKVTSATDPDDTRMEDVTPKKEKSESKKEKKKKRSSTGGGSEKKKRKKKVSS